MKVLVITTKNKMIVKEVNTTDDMREIVGGWIETVHPLHAYEDRLLERDICFVVDEEGLIKNKDMNVLGTLLYNGIDGLKEASPIVGDIFICGYTWEDLRGLTDDEIKCYEDKFKEILERIGGLYNV